MTDTADAPFHPMGCMMICQSVTPCLCIRAFRISQRVGFDKIYLQLCYHKAPAADTSIASGLLGMKRRGCPLFFIILKGSWGHNLYPSLAERFFHILRSIWVLLKTAFSYFIVLIFWVSLSGFEMLRGFGWVLVWDKSSRFTCMWILVVYTGSCSHSNENCALWCDLRESASTHKTK